MRKGAAHRTQFLESRMDELLFAEHVTFLFEPALLRHVNLKTQSLVRSRPLDNGNVHVVEGLNQFAVLREPVRLVLGNFLAVNSFERGVDLDLALLAGIGFVLRNIVGIISGTATGSALVQVHLVLRLVDTQFALVPHSERERVDQGVQHVFLFGLDPRFLIQAVLVTHQVVRVLHVLFVQRFDILLQQKRLGLVGKKGDIQNRHQRLAILKKMNLEHMRFPIDRNTHITVDRLAEKIEIRRKQALDRAAAKARGRLPKQLGSSVISEFDLASVVKVNHAIFKLANEFLQEPVGTLVPETGRRVILSAKHRQEKAKELMPHHEMKTSYPRLEMFRNRNDKIEQDRKNHQDGITGHHVGARLRNGCIKRMKRSAQQLVHRKETKRGDK